MPARTSLRLMIIWGSLSKYLESGNGFERWSRTLSGRGGGRTERRDWRHSGRSPGRHVDDVVGLEVVQFARNMIGQRRRRAVEYDPTRRHADQAVAIAARQ